MKIAIGCDHAGLDHKNSLIRFLTTKGFEVKDFGCFSTESCDYPDIAAPLARAVADGIFDRGILICGTGIGMSIAANKVAGIRAAVCWNSDTAHLVSEHNNANILCLPSRFSSPEQMEQWTGIWIDTPFSSQERHIKRVAKIMEIEKRST
jgi:ribose 5-phosphate isomerase B